MFRSQFKLKGAELKPGEFCEQGACCETCGKPVEQHLTRYDFEGAHLDCPTPISHPDALYPEPGHIELVHERTDKINALREQIGGDHYKNRAIQPIEYCHKNKLGPCESAVVKYITRWREKGGLQDLEKAKHTIDLLIDLEGLKQNVGADHGQTHPG